MFFTPYTILKKLGEGAHGTVYMVEKDGLVYALKFFNDVFSYQKEVAFFTHVSDSFPFFPRFVDHCPHSLYVVMEYLNGYVTLSSHVEKLFQQGEEGCSEFLSDMAGLRDDVLPILDRMCASGITHGDLSLDNIMLHPGTGQVKLLDFGLSKLNKPEFKLLDYKRFMDSIALKVEVYYSQGEYDAFVDTIRQRINEKV
jgi:serine/threonine protein kinase